LQVLGAGGARGGPACPGGNFGGKKTNLGAAPHDWGFAKKNWRPPPPKFNYHFGGTPPPGFDSYIYQLTALDVRIPNI